MRRHTAKYILLLFSVCMPGRLLMAQAYTPVTVTGFNFDAVCEGFPNTTLFTTGTMDLSNHVMYTQSFAALAGLGGGLPNTGSITSAGNTYQLSAYTAANALYLPSGSGTLTLPVPDYFNALSIAAFSTEGSSTIQVTLNYTDGTNTVFPASTLSDWFFAPGAILAGFGRIARVTAAPYMPDGYPSDPRIYTINVTVPCASKLKPVASIGISKISGGNVFVLAVSGNKPPVLTASGGTVCAGLPLTLTSSVTLAGGTYSWSPGGSAAATATVSPTASTTYTLTYTLSGCTYTDTANVNVLPAPVVTVNSDTICPGSSAVLNASGASTYAWSPAAGLSATTGATVTASPGTAAVYTVTGTAANGCSASATATVGIDSVIPVSVNGGSICPGQDTLLTAAGADTYTWSPATGLSDSTGVSVAASPAVTTTYTVTGTNSAGCTGTAVAVVTVKPVPDVTATPPTGSTCDGETTAIALGSSLPGTTFSWTASTVNVTGASNGSGDSITQVLYCITPPTGTATYSVVPFADGCSGAPLDVNVMVGSVTLDSVAFAPISCFGGTTSVTIHSTEATQYSADGGLSFQPSNVFSLHAGTWHLVASKAGGCQDDTLIAIAEPALLTLAAGPDTALCIGHGVNLSTTVTGGTLPYVYTWDHGLPPVAAQWVSPAATDTFRVTVTDANGCGPVSDSVVVVRNPPIAVTALFDQTICKESFAVIGVNATGGNGGPYTCTWTNSTDAVVLNGADQSVSPPVTTTYYVSVTDGCDTSFYSDSIVITVLPLPQLAFTTDISSGCEPLPVNFTHAAPAGTLCSWDFGDGYTDNSCSATHVYTGSGCFDIRLTATSPDGCVDDTLVNGLVCVFPLPQAGFVFGPQPTTVYEPAISFDNLTLGGNTYVWDFGGYGTDVITHPVFTFPSDSSRTYLVCLTAFSDHGCIDSVCHEVRINEAYSVYVPNAFTPNGDGINEEFRPVVNGTDPSFYELLVFNRWGQVVFSTNDHLQGWNGQHGGIKSASGVYVWKLVTRDLSGVNHEYRGQVSLLR